MSHTTQEKPINVTSGWIMLGITIGVFVAAIAMIVYFIYMRASHQAPAWLDITSLIVGILTILFGILLGNGFFTLQPNEGRVLVLFGTYVGSVRTSGFHWTNPFNTKFKLSLRSRNFNTPTLKVNDKQGNPIEIGSRDRLACLGNSPGPV